MKIMYTSGRSRIQTVRSSETYRGPEYLSEEEDDSHSSPELRANRPADHEVRSPSFYCTVCRDSTHRQYRHHHDEEGECEHYQCVYHSSLQLNHSKLIAFN